MLRLPQNRNIWLVVNYGSIGTATYTNFLFTFKSRPYIHYPEKFSCTFQTSTYCFCLHKHLSSIPTKTQWKIHKRSHLVLLLVHWKTNVATFASSSTYYFFYFFQKPMKNSLKFYLANQLNKTLNLFIFIPTN